MQATGKKSVQIYTDGACSGNPGPGGWAAILKFGGHSREISGGMHHTTNNRMEIFAVISALGMLKESCAVDVYSDSSYVVDSFEKRWIDAWISRGWKTADNRPVENQDLWRLLLLTVKKHEVRFHKVPGHADHPENNRCDQLAKEEVQKVIKAFEDLSPAADPKG